MIEIMLLRQAIAIVGAGLAAFTDYKTGFIYDEITYPMILLGVIFNLFNFEFNALIIAAIVFVFGFALYFTGKIGGGDVKLFTGLTLLVPFVNQSIFILNVLVLSGATAVIFLSIYYVLKYVKKGIIISDNIQSIKRAFILFLILILYFFVVISNNLLTLNFAFFVGIPGFFALIFIALEKGIKKNFFLKKIPLKNLEEDDLIATEFLDEKIKNKISLNFKGIIDKELEKKLIELKIKHILVYRNLPKFAPFVLIGVIVSILFPNFLTWVFL